MSKSKIQRMLELADPASPREARWFTLNGKAIGSAKQTESAARAERDDDRHNRIEELATFYAIANTMDDPTPRMRSPRENETADEYAAVQAAQHKLLDEHPKWDVNSPEYASPPSPFDN